MKQVRTPCPHPTRCAGVAWHVAGSPAQRACAVRGRGTHAGLSPAPPAPKTKTSLAAWRAAALAAFDLDLGGRTGDRALVDVLAERHAAQDAASGWDPSARTEHPTGGYTTRQVFATGAAVEVVYRPGRSDGAPARVVYDDHGKAREVEFYREGGRHRLEGPALLTKSSPPTFFVESQIGSVLLAAPHHSAAAKVTAARYAELEGEVGDGALALGWLRVQAAGVDGETVDELVAAGADVDRALEAARAGVLDAQTLAQVLAGELPLSWAAAGLG